MKPLNIATVLSGIGSVEHALHRLDMTHDILVQLNNLGWNVDEKDPKCNVL